MISADNNDIAVAITRAMPGFLKGLEPVNSTLDLGEGAGIGEVAAVDEDVAWGKRVGRDLGVCIGYADATDRRAGFGGTRRFVGGATEVEEEIV